MAGIKDIFAGLTQRYGGHYENFAEATARLPSEAFGEAVSLLLKIQADLAQLDKLKVPQPEGEANPEADNKPKNKAKTKKDDE